MTLAQDITGLFEAFQTELKDVGIGKEIKFASGKNKSTYYVSGQNPDHNMTYLSFPGKNQKIPFNDAEKVIPVLDNA